jgi:hypothetical protein
MILVMVALVAAGAIGWGAALLLGTLAQGPPGLRPPRVAGAAARAHAVPLSRAAQPGRPVRAAVCRVTGGECP